MILCNGHHVDGSFLVKQLRVKTWLFSGEREPTFAAFLTERDPREGVLLFLVFCLSKCGPDVVSTADKG